MKRSLNVSPNRHTVTFHILGISFTSFCLKSYLLSHAFHLSLNGIHISSFVMAVRRLNQWPVASSFKPKSESSSSEKNVEHHKLKGLFVNWEKKHRFISNLRQLKENVNPKRFLLNRWKFGRLFNWSIDQCRCWGIVETEIEWTQTDGNKERSTTIVCTFVHMLKRVHRMPSERFV